MKSKQKSIYVIILLILAFSVQNCSRSGKATVRLNLGLPEKYAVTQKPTLLERVLSLFEVRAYAAAPSGITNINVQVSGSDMDTISKDFAATASISLEVPAGSARTITVIANINPSDPGVVLAWGGSNMVDLAGGETKDVDITMAISETKIVIPDYLNNRIVQINDMTGAGWKLTDFSFGISFRPYDIDFDTLGRIYIAESGTISGHYCVRRVDNIDGTNAITIGNSHMSPVTSLAIDRSKNFVYYSTFLHLYRANLDGTGDEELSIPVVLTIRGMAAGDDGILYIAGTIDPGVPAIIKYNPATQTIVGSVTNSEISSLNTPWHVLIKPPFLYVANFQGPDDSLILQLDMNTLQLVKGYGTNVSVPNTNKGMFYGPHRFVAILNRKITIIDDGHNPCGSSLCANLEKLISMDDINGANWQYFGSDGSGDGNFAFFEYYNC